MKTYNKFLDRMEESLDRTEAVQIFAQDLRSPYNLDDAPAIKTTIDAVFELQFHARPNAFRDSGVMGMPVEQCEQFSDTVGTGVSAAKLVETSFICAALCNEINAKTAVRAFQILADTNEEALAADTDNTTFKRASAPVNALSAHMGTPPTGDFTTDHLDNGFVQDAQAIIKEVTDAMVKDADADLVSTANALAEYAGVNDNYEIVWAEGAHTLGMVLKACDENLTPVLGMKGANRLFKEVPLW